MQFARRRPPILLSAHDLSCGGGIRRAALKPLSGLHSLLKVCPVWVMISAKLSVSWDTSPRKMIKFIQMADIPQQSCSAH
jgi:hypothetical protein